MTINHIAEVAGVSIGSIYQYYPDKYAIVADICNEMLLAEPGSCDLIISRNMCSPVESLEKAVDVIVRERLVRHRTLYRFLRGYYLDIHWRYDFETYVIKECPDRYMSTTSWLLRVLECHGAALHIGEHGRAAELVVDLINGTIHATLQRQPEGIFDDQYGNDLVTLVLRYLKDSEALRGIH